jgi:glucose-1-phosphate thymidylyltransferase
MYPLTKKFPKPLLSVGAFSILDRLLMDLDTIDNIDEHCIVSNATFFSHFVDWKSRSDYKKPIRLINDGATSNETRLGAVRDFLLVIEQLAESTDLLVLAGDNVLDFSFRGFVANAQFEFIALHEKPQNPPSHWAVPPFYYYRKEYLRIISTALEAGCGFDAPGNLAAWLCTRVPMYAWPLPGKRYDIGDLEGYEIVKKMMNPIK